MDAILFVAQIVDMAGKEYDETLELWCNALESDSIDFRFPRLIERFSETIRKIESFRDLIVVSEAMDEEYEFARKGIRCIESHIASLQSCQAHIVNIIARE